MVIVKRVPTSSLLDSRGLDTSIKKNEVKEKKNRFTFSLFVGEITQLVQRRDVARIARMSHPAGRLQKRRRSDGLPLPKQHESNPEVRQYIIKS